MDRIFLTHGHHDHCSGIAQLFNEIGEIPVYMHKADYPLLSAVEKEAKELGLKIPFNFLKDKQAIEVGTRVVCKLWVSHIGSCHLHSWAHSRLCLLFVWKFPVLWRYAL